MPTTPVTILASDTVQGANSENDTNLDYQQDGRLWAHLYDITNSVHKFYYSADGGATWVYSSASDVANANEQGAFFIDKDDYAHLAYFDNTSPGRNVYRLGTPSGDHTSFSWGSAVGLEATAISAGANSILAHREGSGWVAHAFTKQLNVGVLSHMHWRIPIDSAHTIGTPVATTIKNWGASLSSACSADFRHTASDPKDVQSSTPNLYFVVSDLGGALDPGLLYYKATYSAGFWTWSGETEITTAQQGSYPALVYDGTRVMIATSNFSTDTVVRVWERDEANTTSTARDPTALALGDVGPLGIGVGRNGDVWVVANEATNSDWQYIRFDRAGVTWGSWQLLEADAGGWSNDASNLMRGPSPVGLGVMYTLRSPSPDQIRFTLLVANHAVEANLQGVATFTTAQVNQRHGVEAALQGVATVSPDMQLRAAAEVLMQGVSRVSSEMEGVPFHDFTVYDAYLESADGSEGLLFFDEQKPETVSRKLTPTRQDVGNNPFEIRPEFGDMFAQGDFSHGAGQRYFHQAGNDPKKFWFSEGFDISEPGKLTHLRVIAEARDSASIGRIEQVGDLPFVVNAQRVDRGDGNWPGTWTAEDPSAADADQTVNDICAEGARLYAALNTGTASVRIRDSGGTWTHFQVGGVDLVVGTATRLAWLMSRLMVVGGTNARSIYEVAASATPTAIETLPEGWIFADLFEAEGFIHATAVNTSAGLSRVHHYGLNAAGSAIEKKSSTPFPQGQLIYAGCGFPGLAFIGGGVRNSSGGYDPILYRAAVGELGAMQYEEIRQEEGAGAADLSVRAMIPMGETILAGWSLGSAAYGGARDGIAIYHIGRNAFAHHLRKTAAGGALRVGGIMPFKGRVLISITGDGLYYEDLATYMTTAELHTSAADWNNAGLKVWDQIEVSHDALAASHAFAVAYTTETFETATWNNVFTSATDGETREDGRLSNVKARQFALRITSTATASASPVFLAYNVRSLPSPVSPEFQLTRFIRLLGKDRKDEDAPFVFNDPTELLAFLQDAIYSFVNFYESNASWIAWLEDVSTVEPEQPFYDLTQGEALKDAFVVRLQLTGTR